MRKYFQITNKSFEDLGVSNHQELWKKVQSEGYDAVTTELDCEFQKKADSASEFHAILSTANQDRHGDIVVQDWVIGKNIPIIDSHDYRSIRTILGVWKNLSTKTGKLEGDMDFWLSNELGALAKDGVENKYVNFVSVGFIPMEFDKDGKILKSELLEGSLVSVPANKFATIKAEEVPQEEPEEEVSQETEPEVEQQEVVDTGTVLDKKKILMTSILKAVESLEEKNKQSKKRVIFKALRELSK